MQGVISSFSCPVPSTNSTHTALRPAVASPSWLSNKAMGHISEAFGGSLAHPLVSANHSCNWEINLFFLSAGSNRSWGRRIQLPQQHRAKTDNELKRKTLLTAQWDGKSAWEPAWEYSMWELGCKISVSGDGMLFFSLFLFQYYLKSWFLILLAVSRWDFGSFGLTGSRHLGLTADREDGRRPGSGLTGRYPRPDISSHLRGRWIGRASECRDGGVLNSLSGAKSLSGDVSKVYYGKRST